MKHTLISGISILSLLFLFGCGTSIPVVATIGDQPLPLNYFEDNYAKNNGGWDSSAVSSLEDRKRFLDLLIKFKLKVKEARAQGLEKDSAIINELDTYNTSVAQSYILEKEVINPGIHQLYDRKIEEVRASNILFRLPPKPTPQDTVHAYDRAMTTIEQIPQVPFDTLATEYSDDPTVKTNHGDLGFFSGGRMVPEFEDACYSLKPGEYSKSPIRSMYGYHVVKVTARHRSPGTAHISHILLRFNEGMTDTAAVRDSIWMIYRKLKSGANFIDMVKQYSQDPQKNANNGDIGFFQRDRLPQKIADVFYSMKVDSFCEPMQFNYGYHIFKLTEMKPTPSFSAMENDLKDLYKQVRYNYEYDRYTRGLKAQYQVRIDSSVVRSLISSVDTTKISGVYGWQDTLSAEMLQRTLIHSTGKPFTVHDFTEKLLGGNDFKNFVLSPENIWILANKMLDVVAIDEHARRATERYPVLKNLLKEYEEGILLYRVEQDEVWKKVAANDSLLREYYNAHKEEYRWPERVNFAEIFTVADSMAKAAYWKLRVRRRFFRCGAGIHESPRV